MFDCGASSGYGSPSLIGTPLASPAPNLTSYQLHKMFLDQGFYETQLSPQNRFTTTSNDNNNKVPNSSLIIGNERAVEKLKFGTIGNGFGPIQEKVFFYKYIL